MNHQGKPVEMTEQGLQVIESDLPEILQSNILEIAENAEKRIEAIKKIKLVALKVTNSNDWIDEGGKPYLQGSGCDKVARVFGVNITELKIEKTNLEGGHYLYTVEADFSLGGSKIRAIGTRASNSPFFTAKTKWEDENGNKLEKPIKYTRPASEVDEANIKKSAYTNCTANGITKLLGLKNLTWEELGTQGIKAGAKVEYRKKGQGSGPGSKGPATSTVPKKVKEDTHDMLVEMFTEEYGNQLEAMTKFTINDKEIPGKNNLDALSDARLKVLYGKVQKAYKLFKANPEGGDYSPFPK